MTSIYFFILLLFQVCFGFDQDCLNSCPETIEGSLNIHLIPHTHDDVGWLKTVDDYYYGSHKEITPVGVQYILDSVIEQLSLNSDRRFIYVESAFFWRWWNQQEDFTRHKVKRLVQNGQLEFINGGWCMNDEAASHYNAIIDQMSLGLRFLNDTFGTCGIPKVAWQIDPFGHSKEQANLFAQMGFKGLFFGRADYQDIEHRSRSRRLEMWWYGRDHEEESKIFTGILPNIYEPPTGFCFDVLCGDDPIMDDPHLRGYNVEQKVRSFIKQALSQRHRYASDHLVMTMGGDFQYTDASIWYKNMDKLMRHIRERYPKVNIMYSTPSCYLNSLLRVRQDWPIKNDDFFPYASDRHSYWTGYFTSRPTLKGMIRNSNNVLQACKRVEVIHGLDHMRHNVSVLERAMAVAQHHDAVSGTARQRVTDDYIDRLYDGLENCYEVMSTATSVQQVFCPLLNVTQCSFTVDGDPSEFYVTIYNPLAYPVDYYVRFPVSNGKDFHYQVSGSIIAQNLPIPDSVKNIPGRIGHADYEVVFKAPQIPPLSFKSYQVQKIPVQESNDAVENNDNRDDSLVLSNGRITAKFDKISGSLLSVRNGDIEFELNQSFLYYKGFPGNNSNPDERASGAYIFRPIEQTPTHINSVKPKISIHKGKYIAELHVEYNSWISQIVRVFENSSFIEFEWLVGPIPVDDGIGKEIITLYSSPDIKSDAVFYTDSNGRQVLKRKRNSRPTWHLDVMEPVSGNYYPVNSRIFIQDNKHRLSILTDRSQGGTSMKDGEIELMLHRRLLYDDAKGVAEPLNEQAFGKGLVVRGKHWLILEDIQSHKEDRFLALEKYMSPLISFSKISPKPLHKVVDFKTLPSNVHLLTLEQKGIGVLARFEHIFDKNEDEVYSKPVSFDLKNAFPGLKYAQEVSLGGDRLIKQIKDFSIQLQPMEIRSFILKF